MNFFDNAQTIKIEEKEYKNTGINIKIQNKIYENIHTLCHDLNLIDSAFMQDVDWLMIQYVKDRDSIYPEVVMNDVEVSFSSQKIYNGFVNCVKCAAYIYLGYIDIDDLDYLDSMAKSRNKKKSGVSFIDEVISYIENTSDYGISYTTIGEYMGVTGFRAWALFNKISDTYSNSRYDSEYDNIPIQIGSKSYRNLAEAYKKNDIELGLLRRAIEYSIRKKNDATLTDIDITLSINHEFFNEYSILAVYDHDVMLITNEAEFNGLKSKVNILRNLSYTSRETYSYISTNDRGNFYIVVKNKLKLGEKQFKLRLGSTDNTVVDICDSRSIAVIARAFSNCPSAASIKAAILAYTIYYGYDRIVDLCVGYILLGKYCANGIVYGSTDDIVARLKCVSKNYIFLAQTGFAHLDYFKIINIPYKPEYYGFSVHICYIYYRLLGHTLRESFEKGCDLSKIYELYIWSRHAIYKIVKLLNGKGYGDEATFNKMVDNIKQTITDKKSSSTQTENKKQVKKKSDTNKNCTIVIGRKVYKSILEALNAYGIDKIPHRILYSQFKNEPTAFCCFCIAEKMGLANYEAIKQTSLMSQLAYMKNCIIIVNESINKD